MTENKNKDKENEVVIKIPVDMADFSVVEREFSNLKNQFKTQMHIIEEEMIKFQNEFKDLVGNFVDSVANDPTQTTAQEHPIQMLLNKSPLVQKDGNIDILKLRFDIGNYTSEEVDIKICNGKLTIRALHEETTEHKKVNREYNYEFDLPECIKAETIKSSLSQDGVLTVEAPVPPPTNEMGTK